MRTGLPEAIYGPGKTVDQCVALVGEMLTTYIKAPVISLQLGYRF